MPDKIDILARIAHYHEDVAGFAQQLQNLTAAFGTDSSGYGLSTLAAFYQESITPHFSFEEKVVFPALLKDRKNRRLQGLIKELRQEHVALHAAFERLTATPEGAGRGLPASFFSELAALSQSLLSHARVEDEQLVPPIAADPTLRFLMGRQLLALRAEFEQLFRLARSAIK